MWPPKWEHTRDGHQKFTAIVAGALRTWWYLRRVTGKDSHRSETADQAFCFFFSLLKERKMSNGGCHQSVLAACPLL